MIVVYIKRVHEFCLRLSLSLSSPRLDSRWNGYPGSVERDDFECGIRARVWREHHCLLRDRLAPKRAHGVHHGGRQRRDRRHRHTHQGRHFGASRYDEPGSLPGPQPPWHSFTAVPASRHFFLTLAMSASFKPLSSICMTPYTNRLLVVQYSRSKTWGSL